MRASVSLFCAFVLALCAIIVCEFRFGPAAKHPVAFVRSANCAAAVIDAGEGRWTLPPPPEVTPIRFPWELRFGELAAEPESMQSQEELEELADGIPVMQWRAALDRLSVQLSSAGIIVARRLVERWASESPEAAAQWAAGLPDGGFSAAMCRAAVVSWARSDPENAMAWAQQLPAGENKTAAVSLLALEVAGRTNAVAAIALADGLSPGAERDRLLVYAVQQWAVSGGDDAIEWINKIEDSGLRDEIWGKVAVDLGAQDPSAAARLITGRMTPGPRRDDALIQVVRFWAASDPAKAASWVEQLPEKNMRSAAINDVLDAWRRDDPASAAAWCGGK